MSYFFIIYVKLQSFLVTLLLYKLTRVSFVRHWTTSFLVVGKSLLVFFFSLKASPLSHVRDNCTIVAAMFRRCTPSTLATLLQLVALAFTIVKIVCLVASLTFEFELISYKETHILIINSCVIIARILKIEKANKQERRVGFTKTFSITNLFFGPRHLNNSLWMHCVIMEANLLWGPITHKGTNECVECNKIMYPLNFEKS